MKSFNQEIDWRREGCILTMLDHRSKSHLSSGRVFNSNIQGIEKLNGGYKAPQPLSDHFLLFDWYPLTIQQSDADSISWHIVINLLRDIAEALSILYTAVVDFSFSLFFLTVLSSCTQNQLGSQQYQRTKYWDCRKSSQSICSVAEFQ
jgi:hypothetical protein